MKSEIIFLILIIIAIIGIIAYRYIFPSNKNTEQMEDKVKTVQYFGGDYCPFSNTDSNAYRVIKEFEETYGDNISVKYYWVGKDDDLMKKLDVKYVPTILNGENEQLELEIPKDTDTTNLSTDELKKILFENIYNKL